MIKKIVMLLLLLCALNAHAQIVDTWEFNSNEEQKLSLQIASQLRCPQCQNQNLLESNAPTAVSMRHQVFKMVSEGKSESQIKHYMTERYGDFVLYNPPLTLSTLLLWLLPVFTVLCIIFILWKTLKVKNKINQRIILLAPSIPLIEKYNRTHSDIQLLPAINNEKILQYPHWNKISNILIIIIICIMIAGYFLLPRFHSTLDLYQRQNDPILLFTPLERETQDLQRLQADIRQSPENSELWAVLGEYYLYQNSYENALIAYGYALKYRGENAQLYAVIATVMYYQAGQVVTNDTQKMIDKALSLDKNEVTALMLLASDAFINANYTTAINIWQNLLDSNNPRVNRAQIIEAIHMAKLMENSGKQ